MRKHLSYRTTRIQNDAEMSILSGRLAAVNGCFGIARSEGRITRRQLRAIRHTRESGFAQLRKTAVWSVIEMIIAKRRARTAISGFKPLGLNNT